MFFSTICSSDTCAKNERSHPVGYELGTPPSASLFVYVSRIPVAPGTFQPRGDARPGPAAPRCVSPAPPAAPAPGCYGESPAKALGWFWYLCRLQKTLRSPRTPCTHTGKKKPNKQPNKQPQTLKLFTTMDIEIIFEAL